jgi:MFS family permease
MNLLRDRNLHVVFGITLMAVLGVSSIAPVLPSLGRGLDVPPERLGLLITSFTVPGVILSPLLGVLADRFGRRRILVPSLMLFAAAGSACALAPDLRVLLLLRFLQGVGAASLGVLYVTLIGDLYEGRARAAAMGYNGSVLSLGTAAYPLLGGLLAQIGWRWPFLLAALGLPVGLMVLCCLRNPEPRGDGSLRRYLGGVGRSILHARVLALFTVVLLTFVLLYGSYLTYFPVLLDRRFAAEPAVIGLLMTCPSLSTIVVSAQLGRLTGRFREEALVRTAFVLIAAGLILPPLCPSLPWLVVPALLYGAAMGLIVPSVMTLLTGLAPLEQRAAFMSVNGTVLRLGQTLGPVIMGGVYVLGGLTAPFFAGAGLALAAALLMGAVPRPRARDFRAK